MTDAKASGSALARYLQKMLRRDAGPPPPLAKTRYPTVFTLLAASAFIGAAQNVMAPNLTAIAKSFGVPLEQRDVVFGGWMSTAFYLVGAPMSILAGVLADRVNRVAMFLAVVAAALVTVVGTGLSMSVWNLLLFRVLLGAVHGSLNPILFSVIGDLFPPSARPAWSSYAGLAIGGGTAVGQLVAGLLASRAGWRLPYAIIAVGLVATGLGVAGFAREPARGASDAATGEGAKGTAGGAPAAQPAASGVEPVAASSDSSATETDEAESSDAPPAASKRKAAAGGGSRARSSSRAAGARARKPPASAGSPSVVGSAASHVSAAPAAAASAAPTESLRAVLAGAVGALGAQCRRVLAVRTNRFIFAQALFGTIPWSVITVYLQDFLVQDRGLTTSQSSLVVLCFGLGAVAGGVAGGAVGGRLYRSWGAAAPPLVFGVAQAAAAVPTALVVNMGVTPGAAPVALYALAAAAGLVASLTGPNLKAFLLNANAPDTRGAVFTLAYIFDSIAKGIAPVLIGSAVAASAASQTQEGGSETEPLGRAGIFTLALGGWVASGLLILLISTSLPRDQAAAAGVAAAPAGAGGSGGTTGATSTTAGTSGSSAAGVAPSSS